VEFRVLFTIENVGPEPRGITITNNGDTNDNDELIYVTQFLAVDRPGVLIGRDDYKEGRVTVISVADNHVVREVVLNPIAETGFLSNGHGRGLRDSIRKKNVARGFDPWIACGRFVGSRPQPSVGRAAGRR